MASPRFGDGAGRGAQVVLDAGHGGTHAVAGSTPNRAVGPAGTLEKDLALDIGRRTLDTLAEELKADGKEAKRSRQAAGK